MLDPRNWSQHFKDHPVVGTPGVRSIKYLTELVTKLRQSSPKKYCFSVAVDAGVTIVTLSTVPEKGKIVKDGSVALVV